MTKSCNLNDHMASVISSWFPWVTNTNANIMDKNLSAKIDAGERTFSLPEAMVALKWYGNIPPKFKSSKDDLIAAYLHSAINIAILPDDN